MVSYLVLGHTRRRTRKTRDPLSGFVPSPRSYKKKDSKDEGSSLKWPVMRECTMQEARSHVFFPSKCFRKSACLFSL